MERETGIALVRRALDVVESQWPETADHSMQVPLSYYHDIALASKETERFETSPLALIAACEIRDPYDFVVRDAVGRSVLLTRDRDGRARAFLNYCRHRGAEPASGCGNARVFTCPYHAWTYDTAGRLVGMPLRDRHADLNFEQLSLVELPSEERHGFVWVGVRPEGSIDVAAHLGDLDDELASLGCERMHYYNSIPGRTLSASWKCVAEGLLEGLHVPHVHPGTFDLNPQAAGVDLAFYDAIGPHIRYGMPLFTKEGAARLRATPEEQWEPAAEIGCVWFIAPGMVLANELYGMIYADLTPGREPSKAEMRYGWLSPSREAPEGMPSPEEMAERAAVAVGQDEPVWEGCERGLTRGEHGYALIGRNEKGVQLFHERIARETGFDGLRYV